MGILSWILMGALVGLLANWLVPGRFPGGVLGTIVGGVLGAVLGGFIVAAVAGRGVTGFDLVSFLIALGGAALLLVILRAAGAGQPELRERH